MAKIEFFLPMEPPTKTAQEKGVSVIHGKPHFYEKPEITEIREMFKSKLIRYIPEKPFDGAVRLVTKWCHPITGKHKDGDWKTTTPDTDGVIKLFKDSMADVGFFTNDSRVASEITEKFWANTPGIYVSVEEL